MININKDLAKSFEAMNNKFNEQKKKKAEQLLGRYLLI